MKWKNPGHEFDGFYKNIQGKRRFYLYGAGHDGKMVYEILQKKYAGTILIAGILDSDEAKWGTDFFGYTVSSIQEVSLKDVGIILSFGAQIAGDLSNKLESMGLKKDVDFFRWEVFLSVLVAYHYKELFISSIGFLPTTKCNLNCKACLNFTPYIKKFEERAWTEVENDLTLFFSHVDYIGTFHLTGGEPLLCSYIGKLIQHIAEKYREKIHTLEITTNGTVLPKNEFLEAYSAYNINVIVDDYRETLPEYAGVFEKVITALRDCKGQGKFEIRKYDSWIDLAPFSTQTVQLNAEQLEEKYSACQVPWQEYKNGLFYTCNYASFAATAGITDKPASDEFYDLHTYDQSKLKELMEFRLGYSAKGYTEFCCRCGGYIGVNHNIVPPALQMERNTLR